MGRSLLLAGALCLLAAPAFAESPEDRFRTVVIDAGHGGDDHGARGPSGLAEKAVVLDVSERLAARLREQGYRVVMTRSKDVYVPLEARVSIANDARADLFVSIHANAARPRHARGIETYFLSLEASDDASQELARTENQAFKSYDVAAGPPGDPVLGILGDLMANEHLRESNEFARMAQKDLAAIDDTPSRGVKQAPFVVLMGVQMPAVLVEIGFLSNPSEERELRSSARRKEIVESLVGSIRAFAERYDAKRGIGRRPNREPKETADAG